MLLLLKNSTLVSFFIWGLGSFFIKCKLYLKCIVRTNTYIYLIYFFSSILGLLGRNEERKQGLEQTGQAFSTNLNLLGIGFDS